MRRHCGLRLGGRRRHYASEMRLRGVCVTDCDCGTVNGSLGEYRRSKSPLLESLRSTVRGPSRADGGCYDSLQGVCTSVCKLVVLLSLEAIVFARTDRQSVLPFFQCFFDSLHQVLWTVKDPQCCCKVLESRSASLYKLCPRG